MYVINYLASGHIGGLITQNRRHGRKAHMHCMFHLPHKD